MQLRSSSSDDCQLLRAAEPPKGSLDEGGQRERLASNADAGIGRASGHGHVLNPSGGLTCVTPGSGHAPPDIGYANGLVDRDLDVICSSEFWREGQQRGIVVIADFRDVVRPGTKNRREDPLYLCWRVASHTPRCVRMSVGASPDNGCCRDNQGCDQVRGSSRRADDLRTPCARLRVASNVLAAP